MKVRSTKNALIASLLVLTLCISMLIGSTFAWFTDEVVSTGNKIQAGTLKIDLEVLDKDSDTWASIKESKKALFDETVLWEPGYTDVKVLKVENEGNLALKWQAQFVASGELSKLAEVIDVYVLPSQTAIGYPADRNLAGYTYAGTVKEFVNNIATTTNGTLLPKAADGTGGVAYLGLALKMKESANNDYQNLTLGEFDIRIFATQLTHESDSFDNQYDLAATWNGTIPASLADTTLEIVPGGGSQTGTITINSPEDLVYLNKLAAEWVSLYSNGQGTNVGSYRENVGGKGTDYYYHWTWTVELAADLDMRNIPMDSVDISYWDDLEGNGHTISNVVLKDGQDGLFINGAKAINDLTVKNIIVNAPAANTVGAVSGNGAMTNVHVVNATVTGGKYVGGICGQGSSFVNCSIKNSTVTGYNKTVGGLVGYSVGDPDAATVTGNLVEDVTVTGAYNVGGLLGQSQNETVEGNTIKNVTVTSTSNLPADASSNEVRAAEVAARSAFANTTIGTNTVENVTINDDVIVVRTADDLVNAFANLKAGDTISISNDIDMTGKTIAPVTGNKGFTMYGNGNTIKNLNGTERALFVAHSGSSKYTFEGVVLENCSVNSTTNYGALFVGDGDTSDEITIKNCVVKNCTVKSNKYAAAFVGYTAGWNVENDGPVYSDVLIENCSVIGGSITGGGSTAAAIGHAGGNVDTTSTVTGLKVEGVAINGEDAAHTGIVVGTANVGKTIIRNTTYTGVTGNYNTETVLYGRFVPGTTGTLEIDGVQMIYYASDSTTLANAIKNGGDVVLTQDIAITNTLMTTKDVVIDLNGNTMTTPSSGAAFQSQSNASPDITITSSVPGAEINVSGGDTAVLLGYGSTVIENVTINVTGCDNYSPNPFNVYGDLTLGEDTVVNVDYLGTALISNNGAVAINIDGAKINIGTFKTNGTAIITLNQASTLKMKNTDIKIDNFVLSPFGGDSLVSKVDGVTIDGCTFNVTDSNHNSCTFEAKDGKYRLVQN